MPKTTRAERKQRNKNTTGALAASRVVIHWRYHDTCCTKVRVWRGNWAPDQFEIWEDADFQQFQHLAKPLNIRFLQHEDE